VYEDHTSTKNELILQGIIEGMSDGVIILGLDGRVKYTNPAATSILDMNPDDLANRNMVSVFYEYKENDLFIQTILNALYNPEQKHYDLVPYFTGSEFRQLHVMTSILWADEVKTGIIVIISDITELSSLRIRYTQQITALLDSLVKSLSTAIDERSHYTANHTRNMVKMGTAFLDWLDHTSVPNSPLQFDADKRHSFLMSIWLHDVGKLTIPLEVMDKATRLGNHLEAIEQRLNRIHLLDRISMLEGLITVEEFQKQESDRAELLSNILRINSAGYLSEDDRQYVQEIAKSTYQEENGTVLPLLTEEEIRCLQIRKGTLTDMERRTMQSHADMTRRILEHVEFPDAFANVPAWASAHHEFINGSGYPQHRRNGEIPPEVRLLTILDIFEALTAADRPYKQPIPLEQALQILHSMAEEGCLDKDILALFEESRAWESLCDTACREISDIV